MSIVPMLFRDFWSDFDRPMNLFDQNFGLGMLRDELYQPTLLRAGYVRPWRHQRQRDSGVSNVTNDKEKFQIILDVQQFSPNELTVKTVDNFIIVEGNHEEKEDEHGFISRHFVRRYMLPNDVEPDTVVSSLSSDGVLTVSAPKKALPPPEATERIVSITHTGQPALKGNDAKK